MYDTDPKEIEQLIYTSQAAVPMDEAVLNDILETARSTNQKLNITGFLVFDGEYFVQLLEGEKNSIESLYAKIAKDPRHTGANEVLRAHSASRCFSNWSMAFVIAEPGSVAKLGGSITREGVVELVASLRDREDTVVGIIADFLIELYRRKK